MNTSLLFEIKLLREGEINLKKRRVGALNLTLLQKSFRESKKRKREKEKKRNKTKKTIV